MRTELTFIGLAFLLLIAKAGYLRSIDARLVCAVEEGENPVQAGKPENLHHRVADAREGEAPSVSAGRDMGLDENGDAGAVDLGNRGHIDQYVLPAGQAVEEHPPGFRGMFKIDRANDAGSGYRLIGVLQI